EIVRDVLRELDVQLTPEIALPLYVGLVTDTGRFQYTNTTPKALRLAAELVEAGADVHGVFRHVYETVQFAKLKLLARALERAQPPGGPVLVREVGRRDHRLPAPPVRARRLATGCRRALLVRSGSRSSTSRRGLPRSRWSPRCAAARGLGRDTRGRSTPSRRG